MRLHISRLALCGSLRFSRLQLCRDTGRTLPSQIGGNKEQDLGLPVCIQHLDPLCSSSSVFGYVNTHAVGKVISVRHITSSKVPTVHLKHRVSHMRLTLRQERPPIHHRPPVLPGHRRMYASRCWGHVWSPGQRPHPHSMSHHCLVVWDLRLRPQ